MLFMIYRIREKGGGGFWDERRRGGKEGKEGREEGLIHWVLEGAREGRKRNRCFCDLG